MDRGQATGTWEETNARTGLTNRSCCSSGESGSPPVDREHAAGSKAGTVDTAPAGGARMSAGDLAAMIPLVAEASVHGPSQATRGTAGAAAPSPK